MRKYSENMKTGKSPSPTDLSFTYPPHWAILLWTQTPNSNCFIPFANHTHKPNQKFNIELLDSSTSKELLLLLYFLIQFSTNQLILLQYKYIHTFKTVCIQNNRPHLLILILNVRQTTQQSSQNRIVHRYHIQPGLRLSEMDM